MRLERAIDAVVLAALIGVAIQTPSGWVRAAMFGAAVMVVLGWIVAWRRGKGPR